MRLLQDIEDKRCCVVFIGSETMRYVFLKTLRKYFVRGGEKWSCGAKHTTASSRKNKNNVYCQL